ncbi:winged helix-turn-helix domain-containing protein [Streptomyces sp. NPDC058289]|uniref:winged helix-turn-helix domain-containing protein n=1 Tax=Streptomyces sp. NPDC058289 TaxID=3346425 RepID=UPI0036E0F4C2
MDGIPLGLSPKETAVLRLLMRAGGAPVAHDDIVRAVWDEHLDTRTSLVLHHHQPPARRTGLCD